ncbi:hypothetical protein HanPI659440_Chr04g0181401 [Helianthus annuus]|nr:hypothetical protein HanPI659440_Chr04g0181401 [Helianthus annuus]
MKMTYISPALPRHITATTTSPHLTGDKIYFTDRIPIIRAHGMHTQNSIINRTNLPYMIKPRPTIRQHQTRINH